MSVVVYNNNNIIVVDRIKIDNLNKETDIQALTRCVITKAEVIHHNRCQEVEHVLAYLQNRTTAKNG